MKKTVLMIFVISSAMFITSPILAQNTLRKNVREMIVTQTQENENDNNASPTGTLKGMREDVRENVREDNPNLINKVKNFVKKNFKFGARIEGKIAAIGTGSLTVTGNDGKTYQVNITGSTKLIRRFGGQSTLSEFSVGDTVNVFGSFTDTTNTAINATLVRDSSIQKRWGVFFDKVTTKNVDNFVMQTVERGAQTVTFGSAKFIQRNQVAMTYSDLNVGDRVRVKGIWDSNASTITEVNEVKDFSLPVISTPTPTPTP